MRGVDGIPSHLSGDDAVAKMGHPGGGVGWLGRGARDAAPDVGVDGDAEAEVFFAELEGLLAGIADGFGGVNWGGLLERLDDAFGDVIEFGGGGEGGRIDGEEDLRLACFAEGIGAELVGGEAAGEHGGNHVEDDG